MNIDYILKYIFSKCSECNKIYLESILKKTNKIDIKCKKCHSSVIIFSLIFKILKLNIPYLKNFPIFKLIRLICNGVNIFGYQNPIIPEFPFFLFWSITNKCNLNCIYCLWGKREYEEPSKKLCYDIINEFNEHGTIGVNLAGGEPLLRNDLFDIIKYINKKRMIVTLTTNGTLMSPLISRDLYKYGVRHINISIDGLESSNDSLRGTGSFYKAYNAVKYCINSKLSVGISYTVMKRNIDDISEFIILFKELGVRHIVFRELVPTGKGSILFNEQLKLDIKKSLVSNLVDNYMENLKNGNDFNVYFQGNHFSKVLSEKFQNIDHFPFFDLCFPLKHFNFMKYSKTSYSSFLSELVTRIGISCGAGRWGIHLYGNGNVTPCPHFNLILGNLNETGLNKLWKSNELNEIRKRHYCPTDYNRNCKLRYCVGCIARAYSINNNIKICDKQCLYC